MVSPPALPETTDFRTFADDYRAHIARAHETIRTLGLPTKARRPNA